LVELRRNPRNLADGPQAKRASGYLQKLVGRHAIAGGHHLVVREAIPAHAGLGSGTQLALAVAAALRRLYRLPLDIEGDALFLDRGGRSALGAAFFEEGGVALDGGRGEADRVAPIIARLPFPDEWRVLLIVDPNRQGIHGAEEIAAFKTLPPMADNVAAHLCRLAVMQVMPAVVEHDIAGFGRAITEIQAAVGEYFRPVQGGRYASSGVARALETVSAMSPGHGQSSWGPTGFAFAASENEALRLKDAATPVAKAAGLKLRIVRGRNKGAVITETARAVQGGVRHG
jgi:beta-RFAP synthase